MATSVEQHYHRLPRETTKVVFHILWTKKNEHSALIMLEMTANEKKNLEKVG